MSAWFSLLSAMSCLFCMCPLPSTYPFCLRLRHRRTSVQSVALQQQHCFRPQSLPEPRLHSTHSAGAHLREHADGVDGLPALFGGGQRGLVVQVRVMHQTSHAGGTCRTQAAAGVEEEGARSWVRLRYPQGCIRMEGASNAAPEAIRQVVGGVCQSG